MTQLQGHNPASVGTLARWVQVSTPCSMNGSMNSELRQKKDWHSLGGRQFKSHVQGEELAAMMARACVSLAILRKIAPSIYQKFEKVFD